MSNDSLRAQASEHILAISRHQLLLNEIQRQLDAIVYPVLTLPPEITSEIFRHCVPVPADDGREWQYVDLDEAPLLLMHVCSAWRQVTLSTPALWSRLAIDAGDFPTRFSEIVNVWLSRARKCPLSVKIDGPLCDIHNFTGFLKAFRRHSQTMRSLELNITEDDLRNMDTRRLALPLLEGLSLRLLETENRPGPITMFHEVPALREVLLAECPPSFVTLPWNQLTKFTGDCITAADCAKALRLMPNVVECRFAAIERFQDTTPAAFSHPKIESFTLFQSYSEDLEHYACSTDILASLTLPSLQALEILYPDPEGFDPEVFDAFLLGSGSRLQRLVIRGDVEIDVTSLLNVPALIDLEISHPGIGFITVLFDFFGHDHTLIPRLQTLSFLGCRDAEDEGEASVADIVQIAAAPMTDRMRIPSGIVPLQSFRLVSDATSPVPHCSNHELLPFKELKAAGMAIYIGTETESFV
ncbi:hypothetical protein B0H17DRAFT_1199614 [Mycena rosella]|uniref:F-box domain-containing protein n=1 Tax=Mycena rosella TaxID=1033263 RepID=A0AAD7GLW0_MYCRO|nr:hypothetical protein B0H17DRAFT_1199614 [Mycena rosella]